LLVIAGRAGRRGRSFHPLGRPNSNRVCILGKIGKDGGGVSTESEFNNEQRAVGFETGSSQRFNLRLLVREQQPQAEL